VFGAQLSTIYGLSYGEILFAVRVVLLLQFLVLTVLRTGWCHSEVEDGQVGGTAVCCFKTIRIRLLNTTQRPMHRNDRWASPSGYMFDVGAI
jgi:hypothetical protein